jgi:hypothetical protein
MTNDQDARHYRLRKIETLVKEHLITKNNIDNLSLEILSGLYNYRHSKTTHTYEEVIEFT